MLRIKIEYPGRSPAQSIYCCWSDSENVPISQHQWKLEVSCWKNPGSEAFLLKPPVKAGQCLCGESCHNDLGVSQTKQAGTSKRGRGGEKQNSAGDEMLIFSTLVAVVVHTCHCIFVELTLSHSPLCWMSGGVARGGGDEDTQGYVVSVWLLWPKCRLPQFSLLPA
jgi:hypothetical protein